MTAAAARLTAVTPAAMPTPPLPQELPPTTQDELIMQNMNEELPASASSDIPLDDVVALARSRTSRTAAR